MIDQIKSKLEQIIATAHENMDAAANADALNAVRVSVLGKKGQLTEVLKGMKDVPPEERPKVGQLVNDARAEIEQRLENMKAAIEKKQLEMRLKAETIDVTLPATDIPTRSLSKKSRTSSSAWAMRSFQARRSSMIFTISKS